MPHNIKEFRFGRMTRANKYEEYLDGKIWVFSADELAEYPKGAATVRSGLYTAAGRMNLSIRSQINETAHGEQELVIQSYDPTEGE